MSKAPRDIYVPSVSWQTFINVIAPKPKGMNPAFIKSMDQFQRYAVTIQGEVGDAIRSCKDHLERFLESAQNIVEEEAGENSSRLGRLRDFEYGQDTLVFQVFNYKGADTVSVREDKFAALISSYDIFHGTMRFMEEKVNVGDLGILKNSFTFIHKPMVQAAEAFDYALDKTYLQKTAVIGEKADPNFVHIAGSEPSDEIPENHIVHVLKQGFAYEGREIQEGVVIISKKDA